MQPERVPRSRPVPIRSDNLRGAIALSGFSARSNRCPLKSLPRRCARQSTGSWTIIATRFSGAALAGKLQLQNTGPRLYRLAGDKSIAVEVRTAALEDKRTAKARSRWRETVRRW